MNNVTFTPAVAVLTYERVVEQIEHAIVAGDIQPGQRLASERELMVQFSARQSGRPCVSFRPRD